MLAGNHQSALRQAVLISIGVTLVFVAFLPPGIYSTDGNSMLAVAESLTTGGGISVPPGLGSIGLDGRTYSNWYPLLSVLAVPLVYLARVIASTTHLPFHFVAAICALTLTALLSGATAGMVALLARRLSGCPNGAWTAAVSFAFGSVAMVYARAFYAEPLLAFLTVSAIFLAVAPTNGGIRAAASLSGLSVLAKPAGAVLGPILSAYLFARDTRWRLVILPASGTAIGIGTYALYNEVRFGNPLKFGQPWAFHLANLPRGLGGLLFSPEFGLLWYTPAAILAIYGCYSTAHRRLPEAVMIFASFLAPLIVHSCWQYWYGGWSWGPRFLLPGLPALFATTAQFRAKLKKTFLLLSLGGFLVNAPTLFSYYERYYAELLENGTEIGPDIAWSMQKAPWLHVWPAAVREVRDAMSHDVKELLRERRGPGKRIQDSRALRVIAIWWWVLPVADIPRWIGAAITAILAGLGLLFIVMALQRRNHSDTLSQDGAER